MRVNVKQNEMSLGFIYDQDTLCLSSSGVAVCKAVCYLTLIVNFTVIVSFAITHTRRLPVVIS